MTMKRVRICCEGLKNDEPEAFIGVDGDAIATIGEIDDVKFCPHCGKEIMFDDYETLNVEIPTEIYQRLLLVYDNDEKLVEAKASEFVIGGLQTVEALFPPEVEIEVSNESTSPAPAPTMTEIRN